MTLIQLTCLGMMLSFLAAVDVAHAELPADPAKLSTIEDNERTQILVLATPHLTDLGTELNPKAIEPLLARLQSFAPDVVAVEALPPSVIQSMKSRPESFAPVLEQFIGDGLEWGQRAQDALNLPYADLKSSTAKLLEAAQAGQPYDHHALALHFLAMNDLPSAALQWSYLEAEERGSGNSVPNEIAEFLTKKLASPNEIYAVAVPLAKRLRHVRLASIDDHSDKDAFLPIAEKLSRELKNHPLLSEVSSAGIYKKAQDILFQSNRAGDLTRIYRFYNSADYSRRDIQTQWNLFLRTKLKSGLDRTRLALWDVRNFLIAAHIRRVTAQWPGGRILVIVGASHKPFLEAYLSHVMDIRLVPAATILNGTMAQ